MPTTPHGPWPPRHRTWCAVDDCEFTPEASAEGTHYGPEETLLPAGAGRADVRLHEHVPEGTGPGVLLTVSEWGPDLTGRLAGLVEQATSVELDVDDAVELGRTLLRLAGQCVAARSEGEATS
ncbi:MAG: hypothetical protein GEV09_14335 [Pseudonocardiaceae bacterium]|nr:hypothetical protein [Pseudonocardiaceae bacterium]